ncbi:MAG: hypothetical protein HBSAPP02_05650 [Phycisphaerae bacterium]|nr:MAG: hypothetical protein HBSAPP02_05650 [Phycisphaerae bacterium]
MSFGPLMDKGPHSGPYVKGVCAARSVIDRDAIDRSAITRGAIDPDPRAIRNLLGNRLRSNAP